LLRGLPLNAQEHNALRLIQEEDRALSGEAGRVAHLPFFLVTATKL
jgi:hypothetical protein